MKASTAGRPKQLERDLAAAAGRPRVEDDAGADPREAQDDAEQVDAQSFAIDSEWQTIVWNGDEAMKPKKQQTAMTRVPRPSRESPPRRRYDPGTRCVQIFMDSLCHFRTLRAQVPVLLQGTFGSQF